MPDEPIIPLPLIKIGLRVDSYQCLSTMNGEQKLYHNGTYHAP